MDYGIADRSPCSVCGLDALHHTGWFLLVENRWLDRLKILTWHPSLAAQKDVKSACCRQHLRILVTHWIDRASLRLSAGDDPPMPITSDPARADRDLSPGLVGQLVAELSVYREAFSRGWTGSQASMECILDALIPAEAEPQTYSMELQPFPPLHEFSPRLAVQQSGS
jgi:hypothetical protein